MLQLAAARPQELVGKVIGRGVFNRSQQSQESFSFVSFILFLSVIPSLSEGEQHSRGFVSMGPTKGWSTSLTTTTRTIQESLRKYARHSKYLWFISSFFLVLCLTHSNILTIQGVCQCSRWVWCWSTGWVPQSWETGKSPASMTLSRRDARFVFIGHITGQQKAHMIYDFTNTGLFGARWHKSFSELFLPFW